MRGSLPASGGVAVDGSEGSLGRASPGHERASRGRRARVSAYTSGRFHRHRGKVNENRPRATIPAEGDAREDRGAALAIGRIAGSRRVGRRRNRCAIPLGECGCGLDRSRSASRASDGASPGRTSSGAIRTSRKRREDSSRAAGCRVVATPPRRPRICDAPREARLGSTGAFVSARRSPRRSSSRRSRPERDALVRCNLPAVRLHVGIAFPQDGWGPRAYLRTAGTHPGPTPLADARVTHPRFLDAPPRPLVRFRARALTPVAVPAPRLAEAPLALSCHPPLAFARCHRPADIR